MHLKIGIALLLIATSAAFADERPDSRHIYRFDFRVSESDGGKAVASGYTLTLAERESGEIKVGTNVPLAGPTPGAISRADLGLHLRASFTAEGDRLLVDDDLELSFAKDPQTFRKVVERGKALIAPGKPALVASVEDPIGHRRYELTVTATKLR